MLDAIETAAATGRPSNARLGEIEHDFSLLLNNSFQEIKR